MKYCDIGLEKAIPFTKDLCIVCVCLSMCRHIYITYILYKCDIDVFYVYITYIYVIHTYIYSLPVQAHMLLSCHFSLLNLESLFTFWGVNRGSEHDILKYISYWSSIILYFFYLFIFGLICVCLDSGCTFMGASILCKLWCIISFLCIIS